MLGTIINAGAILLGTLIGIFFKKGITEKYQIILMQGIGLSVLLIGFKMALAGNNEILIIISLVLGGLIGEKLKIDSHLNKWGEKLQNISGSKEKGFIKAFVTSSLVYCVGAMAIMGPIESGIKGTHNILYIKSILDGISAIVFSTTLGPGVAFSALAVLIYQGTITILAVFLKGILNETVINYITATGGLLIVGIALNLLNIKEIKVANLLPAILIVFVMAYIGMVYFPNYI